MTPTIILSNVLLSKLHLPLPLDYETPSNVGEIMFMCLNLFSPLNYLAKKDYNTPFNVGGIMFISTVSLF